MEGSAIARLLVGPHGLHAFGALVLLVFFLPHRVVVWVILADFDWLFAVVVAVGMWATLLQRCPHVHSDVGSCDVD
jgi:hypothetical protein